jgi:hypothetical protein
MLARRGTALFCGALRKRHARSLSTTFLDQYRDSVSSIPVSGGEALIGDVVSQHRPSSASSQFSIVDFGLKSEAAFSAKELPSISSIGSSVARTLVVTEDDFNEPVFDHENKSDMPVRLAQRYRALLSATKEKPQFLHGRMSSFKRGGATAKILGFDAFTPRHHVLSVESSIIGSYSPFYLLSLATSKRTSSSSKLPGIDVFPVVSSYGGILFSLANLVGMDEAWEASGGGSLRERLAYLRLLTRVLQEKNVAVRAAMPRARSGPRVVRGRQLQSYSDEKADLLLGDQRAVRRAGQNNNLRWLDRPDFPRVWQEQQGRQFGRDTRRHRGSAIVGGEAPLQSTGAHVQPDHLQESRLLSKPRRSRQQLGGRQVDDGKSLRDVLMRGRDLSPVKPSSNSSP